MWIGAVVVQSVEEERTLEIGGNIQMKATMDTFAEESAENRRKGETNITETYIHGIEIEEDENRMIHGMVDNKMLDKMLVQIMDRE